MAPNRRRKNPPQLHPKTKAHRSKISPTASPESAQPPVRTPSSPPSRRPIIQITLALLVGGLGQWQMTKSDLPATLWLGLAFFLCAGVLFYLGLRGMESRPAPPLPPRFEKAAFLFILLLAACFRFLRLGSVPPGLFLDQGYQGYMALKILHEGYRPFFDHSLLKASAAFLYELAAWFKLFGPGVLSMRVFFGLLSLASLPFAYWAFRELAGPRAGLLALFILAVMRWHVDLSRWATFSSHNDIYSYSSLAFFLYALRTGKRWAFVAAGTSLGLGMYYYIAYYAFPPLLLVFLAYELVSNRAQILPLWRRWLGLFSIYLLIVSPLVVYHLSGGKILERPAEVGILGPMLKSGDLHPLWANLVKLLLLFNRTGDLNGRQDIPLAPLLDDITGVLLVLGFFYVVATFRRRKSFYVLAGMAVLSLPGLLSIDMPHALRLMGMIPFVALASSFPLAALWERLSLFRSPKAGVFTFLVLACPLTVMACQNFHAYFDVQMRDPAVWYWWDPVPTAIGRRIHEKAGSTDFYVTPRCFDNDTVNFLAYPYLENYLPLLPLGQVPPFIEPVESPKGLQYVLEAQRAGMRQLIGYLFPGSSVDSIQDPAGKKTCYFYDVPPSGVEKIRGLSGRIPPSAPSTQFTRFPDGLPNGPFQGVFAGCLYLPDSGKYRVEIKGKALVSLNLGGKAIVPNREFDAASGYYGIRLLVKAPPGKNQLQVLFHCPDQTTQDLKQLSLTTLPLNHGLLASYPFGLSGKASHEFRQWNQVIDYDFRYSIPFFSQGELELEAPDKWTGELEIGQAGWYVILPYTTGEISMSVDGKTYEAAPQKPGLRIYLKRGPHTVVLTAPEWLDNLMLIWEPPGSSYYSPVPMNAFGTTKLF